MSWKDWMAYKQLQISETKGQDKEPLVYEMKKGERN